MTDINAVRAYSRLELALKRGELKEFLTSTSTFYEAMIRDRYGDPYFHEGYVMDAIYQMYDKTNDLDKKVYDVFVDIFENATDFRLIHRALMDMEYHKLQEREGKTTFYLNLDELLKIAEEEMKKRGFYDPGTKKSIDGEELLKEDYYYKRLIKLCETDK